MIGEPMERLSAFLDGEEVEAEALAAALSAEGAREALLDFALLRAEIQRDESEPSPQTVRSIRRRLGDGRRTAWWARVIPVPAAAAAAVLLIGVALSVWAGHAWRGAPADLSEPPPVPDRVIRFEPGVDWQESAG